MSAFGALFYADWRAFVNDGRRALRSPGRLALWALYLIGICGFAWLRTLGPQRHPGTPGPGDASSADFLLCALLAVFAVSLASGRGAIGIFRSRAEARFIIGSAIPAPLAIAYLQTRETFARYSRFLFSFLYFVFVFGPRHLTTFALIADFVLTGSIFAATAAVVVPRRLVHGPAATACAIAGSAGALFALAPAVRDAIVRASFPLPAPLSSAVLRLIPAWHPGRVLLAPDLFWLLAVLAVVAGATALLASAGRDAYPELYALSIARIDRIERWRARRRGASGARATVAAMARRANRTGVAAPAGVLIFVWKSVVEFLRQKQRAYIIGGAVAWCAAGFVCGRFFSADDALFYTVAGVGMQLLLFLGITATNALAGEVRRPLFWLTGTALFERLMAFAAAQVWRLILSLELVAVGLAAGGGKPLEVMFVALGLPALAALLAGAGFVAFALFPSVSDLRGPVVALRFGVSLVLVVPPFALFGIVAAVFDAAVIALAGAVLLALLEAAALIGIAAWRLDGRIDRLAS